MTRMCPEEVCPKENESNVSICGFVPFFYTRFLEVEVVSNKCGRDVRLAEDSSERFQKFRE